MIAMFRFWKKFVHRDGSYDAGGVQGRYVYLTWPAVGIQKLMKMEMMKMRRRMTEMEMMKMRRRMMEMEMMKMRRRMGMVKDNGGQFVACDLAMICVTFGFVFMLF